MTCPRCGAPMRNTALPLYRDDTTAVPCSSCGYHVYVGGAATVRHVSDERFELWQIGNTPHGLKLKCDCFPCRDGRKALSRAEHANARAWWPAVERAAKWLRSIASPVFPSATPIDLSTVNLRDVAVEIERPAPGQTKVRTVDDVTVSLRAREDGNCHATVLASCVKQGFPVPRSCNRLDVTVCDNTLPDRRITVNIVERSPLATGLVVKSSADKCTCYVAHGLRVAMRGCPQHDPAKQPETDEQLRERVYATFASRHKFEMKNREAWENLTGAALERSAFAIYGIKRRGLETT